MKKYLRFLYGAKPFSITTHLPLERAVKRLSYHVGSMPFGTLASQKMMGLVKQDKVIISVVTPIHGAGNGYAATFMGRFFTDNGEVILSGAFRLSTSTRLFISVYFFMFVSMFVSMIFKGMLSNLFDMALSGIMILFMGWIITTAYKTSESDTALIKQEITAILGSEA